MIAALAPIERADPGDGLWVQTLMRVGPHRVGSGPLAWRRYWHTVRNGHARAVLEVWDVVRPVGFIHWRLRADKVRVVDEIAVMPHARRQGVARRMLTSLGRPLEMRIPFSNAPAREWAMACHLQPAGEFTTRAGRTIVYRS